MSYLSRAEKLQADGSGNLVKFSRAGQTIVARYLGRDTVKTKMGEGKRLSVEIVETNIEGVEIGPSVIFESMHITQIMGKNKLVVGQGFILKLCDIDKKSRFKRFGYKRLPEIDDGERITEYPPSDGGDGSPDWLLNTADPDEEREPGSDN